MEIGLTHLDPVLSKRMIAWAETAWGPSHASNREEDSGRSILFGKGSNRPSPIAPVVSASGLTGLLVGATAAIGFGNLGGGGTAIAFLCGWMSFCASIPLHMWLFHRQRIRELKTRLSPTELEALAEHCDASSIERTYIDLVKSLLEVDASVSAETGKGILAEVNALLAQYRTLAKHREELDAAMGNATLAQMHVKREELRNLVKNTQDPIALSAAQQSLDMLGNRLDSVESLRPGYERVVAQQEVILQTFASVHGAIARLNAAPTPVALPSLEEIRRSINDVTIQSTAVEQAVQEVMAVATSST